MGEGNTPFVSRQIDGNEVHFKLDFLQPSGSFKDRGASVLVSLLRHIGVKKVIEDSSGNAGAALSAYAAAAGIEATIYVPEYTPEGKVVQMRMYGSKVVKVPGQRQDANVAALKAAEECMYASHLWHPIFILGLSTQAYEIWENMGRCIPQSVILPVGSGGLLEGLYQGFSHLCRAGFSNPECSGPECSDPECSDPECSDPECSDPECSDRVPRFIGVQAARCAPIHTAFQRNMDDYTDMEVETTIAEGIAVQKPPRARAVLSVIRKSGGYTVSVEEEEIVDAGERLSRMGLFVEPTSASVMAAWQKLERRDREGAVLVLTGSGLKAITTYGGLLKRKR